MFGQETLTSLINVLRRIGIIQVNSYGVILPFISLANGRDTNVYTVFRRLIQDYGYLMMYLIMFAEGLFYGIFTSSVKRSDSAGLSTILYAYMFYPVVFSCIEEKFLLNFSTPNFVYHLIYFVILYRLLFRRKSFYAISM